MTYSDEVVKAVGQDYVSGMTGDEVASKHGMCRPTVYRLLRRLKIEPRGMRDRRRDILGIDSTFFSKIDSHDKAQILGFIFADGCIAHRGQSGGRLQIGLKADDADYLEWICKITRNERPLRFGSYNCKDGRKRDVVTFTASDPIMITDLARYGVVPRKSLVIEFPTDEMVPREFVGSFIRGVFEGDGCIYLNKGISRKHRCADVSIAGTRSFNERLRDILKLNYDIDSYISCPRKMLSKNFAVLRIGTVPSIRRFFRLIYADASFKMSRKHVLFEQFLSCYDESGKYKFDIPSNVVSGHAKAPNGTIYSFNIASDFAREMGQLPPSFLSMLRGSVRANKGWTRPTDLEIESARAASTLVTRLYRQPEVAPAAPAPTLAIAA